MAEPRTPAEAYRSACIRLHGLVEHHRTHRLGSATAEEVLDKLFRRSADVERLFLAMRRSIEAPGADLDRPEPTHEPTAKAADIHSSNQEE